MSPLRAGIGFLVLIAGCLLHLVTKGVLVRNTEYCRQGVYNIVRHPYYFANYLIDTSLCLLSGNPYLLLVYPFLFFAAYGPAMRQEDVHLSALHGESVLSNILQQPQVLPDSNSKKGIGQFFRGFSAQRVTVKEVARISRFWAMSLFLVLIHEVRAEGIKELNLFSHSHSLDERVFPVMLALFFCTDIILLHYDRRRKIVTRP